MLLKREEVYTEIVSGIYNRKEYHFLCYGIRIFFIFVSFVDLEIDQTFDKIKEKQVSCFVL